MARQHELKIHPQWMNDLVLHGKNFELRQNDRMFQKGDILILKEWDPSDEKYTGTKIVRKVSYVLTGPLHGLQAGHAILGLEEAKNYESDEFQIVKGPKT